MAVVPGRAPRPGAAGRAPRGLLAAVISREPAVHTTRPAEAARALRALLPEQAILSQAEQQLFKEWLDRLAAEPRHTARAAVR
jgi:hypothetical protein